MANPSATYSGVNWPGADGIRVPTERGGFIAKTTQTQPSLDTYGEVDLGGMGASTIYLTTQQAGASLITLTPTGNVVLVFPTCAPGMSQYVQNLGGASVTVTCEVNGNASNTAVVTYGKMGTIVHTGTNGGMYLAGLN